MLAGLAPAKARVVVGGPGDYVCKSFINATLGKPFIALGAVAVFITLRGLGYRYNKTEVALPNWEKALPGRVWSSLTGRAKGLGSG